MIDLLRIKVATGQDDWEQLTADYEKDYIRNVIQDERKRAINFLRESIGD